MKSINLIFIFLLIPLTIYGQNESYSIKFHSFEWDLLVFKIERLRKKDTLKSEMILQLTNQIENYKELALALEEKNSILEDKIKNYELILKNDSLIFAAYNEKIRNYQQIQKLYEDLSSKSFWNDIKIFLYGTGFGLFLILLFNFLIK